MMDGIPKGPMVNQPSSMKSTAGSAVEPVDSRPCVAAPHEGQRCISECTWLIARPAYALKLMAMQWQGSMFPKAQNQGSRVH